MANQRLNEWLKDKFVDEPQKPTSDINEIIKISYSSVKDSPIQEVEQYIFVMSSWLFYISYQLGLHESRSRAKGRILEDDIVFASQKYKSNNHNERVALARANDDNIRKRCVQQLADEAKVITLKELKYALRDKIDAFKMLYFRKRGEE